MNNMDYPPSFEPAGQPMAGQVLPWHQVWMQVLTRPSKESFRRILSDPTAKAARAFIWMAVLGLIFGVIQAIVAQVMGVSPVDEASGIGLATSMVCFAVGTPIFSVIGLAIGAGILRLIAGMLGGTGNFNDMAYSLGAISAPISIVTSLISLIVNAATGGVTSPNMTTIGAGSIVSLCMLPISLAVAVYAIVLQVNAVSEVEKLTTGKAVLAVLIPVIALIILVSCVVVVFGAAFFALLQQMGQ